MGACCTKEGRNQKLDAKEEKLDGNDAMLEKTAKPQNPEETSEEKEFKERVVEIKSENEETNVTFNLH